MPDISNHEGNANREIAAHIRIVYLKKVISIGESVKKLEPCVLWVRMLICYNFCGKQNGSSRKT